MEQVRLPGRSTALSGLSLAWLLALGQALRLPIDDAGGALTNPTKCDAASEDGEVMYLTDGTDDRCFSVITPKDAARPMPLLFWFHVSTGSAAHCAHSPLARLARRHGFALVCAEALQEKYGDGGQWTIPEVQTDATGTRCGQDDSPDIPYMEKAVDMLSKTGIYDTEKLFFSGCSMGSGFSIYIAQCMKSKRPHAVSAFATHSTGLKVKGDGNNWPHSIYHDQYVTAECPECHYFPIVPKAFDDGLGLKACVFDNTDDPSPQDPFFYRSSIALSESWSEFGMKHEQHFFPGGHCENIPHAQMLSCLDDGTGRLLVS